MYATSWNTRSHDLAAVCYGWNTTTRSHDGIMAGIQVLSVYCYWIHLLLMVYHMASLNTEYLCDLLLCTTAVPAIIILLTYPPISLEY